MDSKPLPKIYAHIAPDGLLLDARAEPPVSWTTIGGAVHEYVPSKKPSLLDQSLKTLWARLEDSKRVPNELDDLMLANMRTAFDEVIQEALRVERKMCQDPRATPSKDLLEWIFAQLILEPTTTEILAERWFQENYVNVEVPYSDNEEAYWKALETKWTEMDAQKSFRETEVHEALSILRHIVKAKFRGCDYFRVVTPEVRQKLIAAAQPEKT